MVAGLQKYWGINHTNNQNGVVFNNTVTGAWNGNKSPMTDSLRAYLSEYNISEQITCNYANNTGRGYEFFLDNPGMRWVKNEMDEHMKGMVLNHALIGDQGWVGYPFDNSWNSTTWGWSHSAGKDQTYVIETPNATFSDLYVQSGTPTNPTENWGYLVSNAYSSASIHVGGSFGVIDCQSGPISDNPVKRAASYEPNVKDLVTYAEYTDARKWIGQFAAWQAVKLDTVLTDSSVVLAQFKTMASGSRFAHLSDIEDALTAGDMTTAAALIATTPAPLSPALCIDTTTGVNIKDDSTIDYIVNTHKEFYTIYLHYLQYAMDSVDSASIPVIAQLCPLEYGSVVYKARALYTNVWNDLQVWCEGCDAAQEEEQGGGQRPTIKPTTNDKQGQIYTLYPNPNDGNITLVQKIADTTAIVVDVSDVLGRSVFNEEVRFSNNSYKLNLDKMASGMYVTSIIDAKGRMYIFKFVKQ